MTPSSCLPPSRCSTQSMIKKDVYEFHEEDQKRTAPKRKPARRRSLDCDSPDEVHDQVERSRSRVRNRSAPVKSRRPTLNTKRKTETQTLTASVVTPVEPRAEYHTTLCSSPFVLKQDACVLCGAVGSDSEGRLIACVQCGQCYHPYCAGVKVSRIVLLKGWRCIECTVCEGCGSRDDESQLLLCDGCDVSYHTYCATPPLDHVPDGTWKCGRCAGCDACGARDPGFNSGWQQEYTRCGPCASLSVCPSCNASYNEGQLIVRCMQCRRWLHGSCDQIRTEWEAERCGEVGYNCPLCRPNDVPPPHLATLKRRTPSSYLVDGICLSETGMAQMKSLGLDEHRKRKNRKNPEDGILAAIESVVSGTPDSPDVMPQKKSRYTRFGIGGFVPRSQKRSEDSKRRRKPRVKLLETFPAYLQEAFFGKELLQRAADPEPEQEPEPVDQEASRKMMIVKEIQEIERAVEAQHIQEPEVVTIPEDDEGLSDFLLQTGGLLDIDLDSIMGEELDTLDPKKDQFDSLLAEDDRLDCLPNMDGDEVEDVLKVLQDGQDYSIVATVTSSVATTDFSPGAPELASAAGSPLDMGMWARDT